MNAEIRTLIDSLRLGNFENPAEKISLLAAALRESAADVAFLRTLLNAPQIPLRLASVEACLGRPENELHRELAGLAKDRDIRVRVKATEVLASFPEAAALEALKLLCADPEDEVRIAALKATAGRRTFIELHKASLANGLSWPVHYAAATSLDANPDPAIVRVFFNCLVDDSSDDVKHRCTELIEQRLTAGFAQAIEFLPRETGVLLKAKMACDELDGNFPKFSGWLGEQTASAVDSKSLERFGTDLTTLARAGSLPHAYCAGDVCQSLMKLIAREPRKSIVVLGEAGVGKSALVNELTYELAKPENGEWRVLRVSPTDIMADTKYTGEWESKVRDLIVATKKPKRVVIYVPNVSGLAAAGRWSKSDNNVAAALSPYLENGDVLLLGEDSSDAFERGLGAIPSLRRLFDQMLVIESSKADTQEVLRGIRTEAKANIADDVLEQLQDVSDYFLSHMHRPGNAAGLLRAMIGSRKSESEEITFREVLKALSGASGVPTKLLDDTVPLDLNEVREFFEKRIIGQPEAVDAVIDLVTLIKAGLTDPNKPFGVYLFVGPTGVGKTELARALAEFIFGDVKRLLRLDMSEFAQAGAFERLIGGRDENGLLTGAVRQQPFSVVLLDEIEKSHVNVFDLCLQIFDAGRLTDGRGHTVDFRRTIVILTSNIGASIQGGAMGFGSLGREALAPVDKDRTFRELSQFFRPEFLNRLDRIINFQPLSLEVAERIARREIQSVLQRSGIARRDLTVDVNPAVISFLVKEGYSPHFGARPLKRTVERFCLLPLARAISGGKIGGKSVLALKLQGGKVVVEIARSEAKLVKVTKESPEPLREVFAEASQRLLVLTPRVQALAQRKSGLLEKTQQDGFYNDRETRDATFDEIHKLDQFINWHERVCGMQQKLEGQFGRRPLRETALREQLAEFNAELEQIEFVSDGQDGRDLGDALLCLNRVDHEGEALAGVEKLARMYLALAKRRRMSAEVLAEFRDEESDRIYLQIAGLGAFALLKAETGLHELNQRFRVRVARGGREKERQNSEVIRVEVFPMFTAPTKQFLAGVKSQLQPAKSSGARLLDKGDLLISLFHEPSLRSLEVWANGPKAAALERVQGILHALVEGGNVNGARTDTVRRYDIGTNSRVKDLRTGRATVLVDQVFKGRLDLVLSREDGKADDAS